MATARSASAIQAEARKLGMRLDPHLVFLNLHNKRIEAQPGNRAMPAGAAKHQGKSRHPAALGRGKKASKQDWAGRDRAVSSGRGNGEDRSRRGGRPPASGQRRPGGPRLRRRAVLSGCGRVAEARPGLHGAAGGPKPRRALAAGDGATTSRVQVQVLGLAVLVLRDGPRVARQARRPTGLRGRAWARAADRVAGKGPAGSWPTREYSPRPGQATSRGQPFARPVRAAGDAAADQPDPSAELHPALGRLRDLADRPVS